MFISKNYCLALTCLSLSGFAWLRAWGKWRQKRDTERQLRVNLYEWVFLVFSLLLVQQIPFQEQWLNRPVRNSGFRSSDQEHGYSPLDGGLSITGLYPRVQVSPTICHSPILLLGEVISLAKEQGTTQVRRKLSDRCTSHAG